MRALRLRAFARLTCLIAGVWLATAAAWAQPPKGKADPRLAEAQRALTRGELDRAFELGSAYLKAHPRDAAGRLLLARVHVERDDLDKAYEELDRALRVDPNNVDVLAYLGLVSAQLSASAFHRLETEAPASARVHQLKGETFEAQERRADAEKAYEAALAAQPDLLDVLLPLARLKRIRLACEEAVVLYERAEAVMPTFDAAYGLGFCQGYLQDHAGAVVRFEQAVKRDPKAALAWSGLGTALVNAGRRTDGIAALRKAVTLEPELSEAWYMLGLTYQAAGDDARSKEAFAKVEELRAAGKP